MHFVRLAAAIVIGASICQATSWAQQPDSVTASLAGSLTEPAQERQIEALLGQMTLQEKLGQLTQFPSGVLAEANAKRPPDEVLIRNGQVGSLLGVVGSANANRLQHIAVEQSRLHIPLLFGFDVIHGDRTIFPIPLALAASFDLALIETTASLAAKEARADGIQWVFSPMVDIARDARWGRITESAGEDPFLGSEVAKTYIRGYQGKSLLDTDSVAACVKHFAAYGAAVAGRDYNTVDMSETLLRQVYLPPYHAAVDAGAATVMTSFNSLNGVPSSANRFLLTDILRGEWGFQGFTVSDWGAVRELIAHGNAATPEEAGRLALDAGTDMDMESGIYGTEVARSVQAGDPASIVIDSAVRRVLRVKFALGLFAHPYADESLPPYRAAGANRALARHAAEESFVLLKNDPQGAPSANPLSGAPIASDAGTKGQVLPLDPAALQKIALIGPLADDAQQMLGSWAALGDSRDVVTLRQSLQSRLGSRLTYVKGTEILGASVAGFADAVDAAKNADVAILAVGEDGPAMTGEGSSRTRLDLPGNQEQLLEAVAATGKPVILVVFSGRPLAIPWAARHVPAILEAWFPGIEAGPALTATLFGESVPSGKLPAEFPYAVGQEPLYLAQLPTGRPADGVDLSHPPHNGDEKSFSRYIDEFDEPLYPFGWGLSYCSFRYSNLQAHADAEGRLVVEADVKNLGTRTADEVVQLYFHRHTAPVEQPVRELKGFERISLAQGASRHIVFRLTQKEIAFFSGKDLVVGRDGQFDLWVGGSSAAAQMVHVSSRAGKFLPD